MKRVLPNRYVIFEFIKPHQTVKSKTVSFLIERIKNMPCVRFFLRAESKMLLTVSCFNLSAENSFAPSLRALSLRFPFQCYNIARTTILEFANQICGRAKEFDSDILGMGLQKVADDAEDACKVFCETKSGTPKTKSWIFPDGTACRVQSADFDDYFYCIGGRCQVEQRKIPLGT